MIWDWPLHSSSASQTQTEGVRSMAKNNERNQNGAGGTNKTNMVGGNAGEAVGTVGGAAVGAAVGSILGPIGTVAGAVAGGALGNQMGEGVEGANNNAKNERGTSGNNVDMNRTE
ncbi:hypothetical protein [Brevibacillus sp. NRS-1366]|uniref:hypothetical protein n=1 Tax=Brevibacillus sp. NRS-1366 TaxID=3233899 RepID=UPI003D24EE77